VHSTGRRSVATAPNPANAWRGRPRAGHREPIRTRQALLGSVSGRKPFVRSSGGAGDDDRIVPIEAGRRSARNPPNTTLVVHEGAPHELCGDHKTRFDTEPLEFTRE
jgi:hypothetical protein